MARKQSRVVIRTADNGVCEIGDGLGDFATAAKGGAERDQGKIDSAKALGRDAALESRLGPAVDALVGRLEVEF
jgi:hypothetical protein